MRPDNATPVAPQTRTSQDRVSSIIPFSVIACADGYSVNQIRQWRNGGLRQLIGQTTALFRFKRRDAPYLILILSPCRSNKFLILVFRSFWVGSDEFPRLQKRLHEIRHGIWSGPAGKPGDLITCARNRAERQDRIRDIVPVEHDIVGRTAISEHDPELAVQHGKLRRRKSAFFAFYSHGRYPGVSVLGLSKCFKNTDYKRISHSDIGVAKR